MVWPGAEIPALGNGLQEVFWLRPLLDIPFRVLLNTGQSPRTFKSCKISVYQLKVQHLALPRL